MTQLKNSEVTCKTFECKNLINGQWVNAESGKTFKSTNPANVEDVVGIFPSSGPEDVIKAIEAAKNAFRIWSLMPAPKRGEILFRAAEILRDRKEDLGKIVTREMGKILPEGLGDVQEVIDTMYFAAGEGRRLLGQTTPSELKNKFAMSIRQPVGVCGLITPWNFPMAIPSWKIAPALIAGNTIVFKPASYTPLCAAMFVEILKEAGVPDGVLNIVHGSGSSVGNTIVEHPDVKLVSFTGSSDVGRSISEKAARQFKRCSMELGGKNSVIIMDDANLELAVDGVLWGAFGTSGQRCTATSRAIVHKDIHKKFVDALHDRVKSLKLGYGLNPGVEMGPVVSEGQLNIVHKYVQIAKEDGGRLIYGGETDPDAGNGWFYKPTIFDQVTTNHRIFKEEIFGPVLGITMVSNLEEAIRTANDCEYGLSNAIYTKDVNAAFEAMRDLESGIMYVNAPTIGAEVHLPFGGWKNTGNGHREAGEVVLDIFTEWKTIYVDYSNKLQRAQIDLN